MAVTIHETNYNGHVNKVVAYGDTVSIEYLFKGALVSDAVEYTREEAIVAAKAILLHFGESV